jgi:hypothetical protein
MDTLCLPPDNPASGLVSQLGGCDTEDAADSPRIWKLGELLYISMCGRFTLAFSLTLVVFAHPHPDFHAPICVKRVRFS